MSKTPLGRKGKQRGRNPQPVLGSGARARGLQAGPPGAPVHEAPRPNAERETREVYAAGGRM